MIDNTAFEHFRDKGSIKSYKGTYSLNSIIYDIDRGKKTGEDTRQRAIAFINTLIEQGVDGIGIAIASEVFKLNDIEKFLNSSVILALTFNDKIKKIKIQSNFFTLIFFFPNIIK